MAAARPRIRVRCENGISHSATVVLVDAETGEETRLDYVTRVELDLDVNHPAKARLHVLVPSADIAAEVDAVFAEVFWKRPSRRWRRWLPL